MSTRSLRSLSSTLNNEWIFIDETYERIRIHVIDDDWTSLVENNSSLGVNIYLSMDRSIDRTFVRVRSFIDITIGVRKSREKRNGDLPVPQASQPSNSLFTLQHPIHSRVLAFFLPLFTHHTNLNYEAVFPILSVKPITTTYNTRREYVHFWCFTKEIQSETFFLSRPSSPSFFFTLHIGTNI